MKRALILLVFALSTLLAPPLSGQGDSNLGTYSIGPRDEVRVRVFEVDELNDLRLRVNDNGAVNLPIVGPIFIEGKTQSEFADELKLLLEERYVQKATVDVQVLEFRSNPISVIGAVNEPGDLPFSGRWTLLDALTAAGGLANDHGTVLYIHRRSPNGLSDQVQIDLRELLVNGNTDVNLPIYANDLINVPADVSITVYCLGAVAHPGALEFKSSEKITILAAIARAGGLTERASKKIVIQRSTRIGTQEEILVDYKRMVSGRDLPVELMQGDVVIVKESFF